MEAAFCNTLPGRLGRIDDTDFDHSGLLGSNSHRFERLSYGQDRDTLKQFHREQTVIAGGPI
jgi:hypothetical protein